jgi:hypothetical protein
MLRHRHKNLPVQGIRLSESPGLMMRDRRLQKGGGWTLGWGGTARAD